jgi:hypothetical protein
MSSSSSSADPTRLFSNLARETYNAERNGSATNPGPQNSGLVRAQSQFRRAAPHGPWRRRAILVLLRSHPSPHSRRRLDASGHVARAAGVQGSRRRQYAADQRQFP